MLWPYLDDETALRLLHDDVKLPRGGGWSLPWSNDMPLAVNIEAHILMKDNGCHRDDSQTVTVLGYQQFS